MYKLNLLYGLLIGLTIFSCSSDDSNDNDEQPQLSQLVRVEQNIIDNGTSDEKIIFDYDNNKLELISFYNVNEVLVGTTDLIYNSQGLLIRINNYDSNNTLTGELVINYDNQNRIVKTDQVYLSNPNNHIIVNFTHNNDNTILSSLSSQNNNQERIFEVNSNGIIDKEIWNGTVSVSVQYDNFKPISKTNLSSTSNYSYLETGVFPFPFYSIFGENPINIVLFQNSLDDASDSLTSNLISEITSSTNTQEYVYTLNDDNFPLTRKDYYNGELISEQVLFYE